VSEGWGRGDRAGQDLPRDVHRWTRTVANRAGSQVALDQDGFVVLEVNGKHLLIPKARIDTLVEVE
jgi:hypothetical protein